MRYNPLGDTAHNVSVICLGTMTWGVQNSEQDAHDQLSFAVERGVNFIDTAELYPSPSSPETQGLTETYIGTWLKNRADRDKLIIASKATGPSGRWVKHIRGGPRHNADHLQTAVDASLKRLQTDYIDLYQLHWPSRNTNFFGKLGYKADEDPFPETIPEILYALGKLVDSGKIRHIGLSNETPWGLMQYLNLAEQQGLPRVVSVQNPYNLLNRTYEIGLAEMSHREKVGLLAYSPLGFGALSGKYLGGHKPADRRLTLFGDYFHRYSTPRAVKATAAYAELAQDHGLTPTQLALAFVNQQAFLTANIIGATRLDQLEENIATAEITLSDELIAGIEAIHGLDANPCP